jgi:hypothetical protein
MSQSTAKARAAPVTAVIVTYQSAHTIGRTLAAARRSYDEGLLDLVIVDNASGDATPQILRRESPWARIVLSERNNGFGRGCNIGFEHVTSPYTLFLNPDAVIEPDAIRKLVAFMEANPGAGIAGPAILCGDDGRDAVLQHCAPRPTPWTVVRDSIPLLRRQSGRMNIVPGSAPMRTGWVSGAVYMIRSALMRRLEGFDPRFFLYWEEIDLCERAANAGYETWAVGQAVASHIVGASSRSDGGRLGRTIAKHYFQSRYYYLVKHHGRLAATAAEVGEFALLGLESLLDGLRGRGLYRLRPRLKAMLLSMPDER